MLIDHLLSKFSLGIDIGFNVACQQLRFGLISEHANKCGIHLEELAVQSHTIDSIRSVLHQRSKTGFGTQEILLNAPALRDISRDGRSAHDLSAGIMNR